MLDTFPNYPLQKQLHERRFNPIFMFISHRLSISRRNSVHEGGSRPFIWHSIEEGNARSGLRQADDKTSELTLKQHWRVFLHMPNLMPVYAYTYARRKWGCKKKWHHHKKVIYLQNQINNKTNIYNFSLTIITRTIYQFLWINI